MIRETFFVVQTFCGVLRSLVIQSDFFDVGEGGSNTIDFDDGNDDGDLGSRTRR